LYYDLPSSKNFFAVPSHLQGCALKLQTVKSHEAMASAMRNTAVAMKKMNKAVNVQTIAKMMAEFERENAKTEMMQEVMGDAIDDALAEDEAEEEQEKIVNQVLDEIGISFGEELPEAAHGMVRPETEGPTKIATPAGGTDDSALSDLEARLNNLKR
jgi:charged multivesicular body protein 2A